MITQELPKDFELAVIIHGHIFRVTKACIQGDYVCLSIEQNDITDNKAIPSTLKTLYQES